MSERLSYQTPVPISSGLLPVPVSAPSGAGRNGSNANSFDILALLKSLRRRWPLALMLGLLLGSTVGGLAWLIVPSAKYTASSILQVKQHTPVLIFEPNGKAPDFKVFQKTQIAFLQSDKVLRDAIHNAKVAQLPTVIEHAEADRVEWLKEQLKILFNGESEILLLSMSGDRPGDVATIVNAVVESYMKNVVNDDKNKRRDQGNQLRTIWDGKQKELELKRKTLKTLGDAAGSTDRETLAFMLQETIFSIQQARVRRVHYQDEINKLQLELDLARPSMDANAKPATDKKGEAPPQAVASSILDREIERDQRYQQLEAEVYRLEAQVNRVRGTARSKSDPAVLAATKQRQAARQHMDEYATKLRADLEARIRIGGTTGNASGLAAAGPVNIPALEKQLAAAQKYKDEIDKEILALQAEAKNLNSHQQDVNQSQEEILIANETARKVGTQMESIQVELDAPPRVVLIDPAEVPRKKDEMKRLRLIGAAAGGAFVFALFGVGFWEYRARRISSVEEVINSLGMTIVGALPAMPDRARRKLGGPSSKLVEERWQKLLVESVDAMRTMLLHASRVESLRVVMVTSAGQGEGKTSLAGHLATSLARAGRNTLLVDCDIRRPTIHRLFDEPIDPGLCELLRGDISPLDVIRQGPTPDLSIVTAGRHDELAQQMLGQDRVRGFFDEWKQQFEFVIIDTPPVLPVADSLLLAPHVDGALFAILRGVSRVPQVQAAYERLSRLGTRMLGAVVNGAESDASQYSSLYYINDSSPE